MEQKMHSKWNQNRMADDVYHWIGQKANVIWHLDEPIKKKKKKKDLFSCFLIDVISVPVHYIIINPNCTKLNRLFPQMVMVVLAHLDIK